MEQLPFIGFVLAAFCAGAWVAYIVIPMIPRPRLPDLSKATGVAKSFAGSNIRLPLPLVLAGVIALAAWGASQYQPSPTPPVPPDPTPPIPIVVDKLDVLIVRETEDTTPQVARVTTALRSGPAAEYLASKGHRLQILDDDATDSSGQPMKLLQQFAPYSMPELLLLAGDKLLARQPLPATAEETLTVIRTYGG